MLSKSGSCMNENHDKVPQRAKDIAYGGATRHQAEQLTRTNVGTQEME